MHLILNYKEFDEEETQNYTYSDPNNEIFDVLKIKKSFKYPRISLSKK